MQKTLLNEMSIPEEAKRQGFVFPIKNKEGALLYSIFIKLLSSEEIIIYQNSQTNEK